jgi:ribonuclease HII
LTRALNQAGLRIRDSKQLLPDERARISSIALELEIAHGIGLVAASEIDQMGLGKANREVFARAVSGLGNSPDVLLTDAFIVPTLTCQQQALIRGDALSLTIALASIIAKHHRDSLMAQLAETHPGYGFARHKGYGTRAHAEALAEHGACPEHRRSFRPVAEICRSA